MKRIVMLVMLALLVTGCVTQVLENPADPQWNSDQIDHAYRVQGDAMLLAVWIIFIGIAGTAGAVVMGLRRRR